MALDQIAPFFSILGVAVIAWSLMQSVRTMSRGYGGAASQAIGGVLAGGALLAVPTVLPSVLGSVDKVWGTNTVPESDVITYPEADQKPEPTASPEATDQTTLDVDAAEVFATIGIVLAILVTVGLAVAIALGIRAQRRKAASKRAAAERARVEEEARLDRVWDEAVARHDHLREESMRHQSDIDLVLSMPLINDFSEPKTAEFIQALGKAADLAHDTRPSSVEAVEAYADATRTAERAWGVAWRHADRVRLSQFDPAERATIKQVIKLMKRAEFETTPEARAAYYRKAVKDLGHLIEIPRPAVEAIEQKVAGVLANPAAVTYHDAPTTLDDSIFNSLLRKARAKVTR